MINLNRFLTQEISYRPHYRVPTANSQLSGQAGSRLLNDKVADLITFLAISHEMALDMIFITWKAPLGSDSGLYGPLGFGGTAEVQQRTLHLRKSLAFKRPKAGQHENHAKTTSRTQDSSVVLDGEYRNLSSEIMVLCAENIRGHPNIINIEAICWDFNEQTGLAWPILVFDRAEESDLETFMNTRNGRSIDNRKRLELCQDVALAMVALHRYGIIHADINPRNLLVFRDDKDGIYVKLSDFGYAALMYEGDQINMPRTPLWCAPEIGSQWSFEFEDARRTDYYSFALVCAYLLWHGEFEDQFQTHKDTASSVHHEFEQARQQETLLPRMLEIVQSLKDVDQEHKRHLQIFFERALNETPEQRSLYLPGLFFEYAKRTEMGKMVYEDFQPKFFERPELPWAAQFRITKVWPRAMIGDFRLWPAIFKALEIQVKAHPDKRCRNNAAMQIAICFKLGFGCIQSLQQSSKWLEQSSQTQEEFERQIKSTESPQYWVTRGYDLENWGHADPTPAYIDDDLLPRAETMHRIALSNLRQVFTNSHPLIHEQCIIISRILIGLSRWQEAYDLISPTLEDCRVYKVPPITLARALETKRFICAELSRSREAKALWTELNSKKQPKRVRWDTLSNSNVIDLTRQGGIIELEAQDYAEAETTFLRLTKLTEDYYGPGSDSAIEAKALLAILHVLSNNTKSIRSVPEALDLCDKHNTTYTRSERLRLRILLCRQGNTHRDPDEIFRLAVQNVDDCRKQLGLFHRHTLLATEALSSWYRRRGSLKEAQSLQEAVVEASTLVFGEDQPVTAYSKLRLASILRFDVRWEQALDLAESATNVLQAALGDEHQEVAFWLLQLADWRRSMRRWEVIGYVIPIVIIEAVGRRLNHIWAWMWR